MTLGAIWLFTEAIYQPTVRPTHSRSRMIRKMRRFTTGDQYASKNTWLCSPQDPYVHRKPPLLGAFPYSAWQVMHHRAPRKDHAYPTQCFLRPPMKHFFIVSKNGPWEASKCPSFSNAEAAPPNNFPIIFFARG